MSPSHPLPSTRLAKVPGERRWVARPAYVKKPCTPDEIAQFLHSAEHDLAHAADPATDPAARYRAAAEAALGLSAIVLRASGYESTPALDSQLTFEALPDLFGPEGRGPAKSFLAHYRSSRRMRGAGRPEMLERSTGEILRDAGAFRQAVLEWLEATRRHLLPAAPTGGEQAEDPQRRLF